MKKFYIILFFCLFAFNSWSQEYKRMIDVGTYTVQEIMAEAEAHFAVVGTQRGTGYNPYKRWEYQALRAMNEDGTLNSPTFYFNELENYNNYVNQNSNVLFRSLTGNWEELGPTYWNQGSGWNPGVGRVTSISVETTNHNHIIIGGETGGVWRTTDGGSNWTVLTDNLSNLNVYSLTIDPTNPSIYYWGSNGGTIFKSTNSGSTWNYLSNAGGGVVNKILIDPTNANKMYCSVQGSGIFKSTNGGLNWSLIAAGATTGYDVEFKPGNTNVVYASGNNFYRSDNGGTTFTQSVTITTAGPKMIAVSANNPEVVYVVEAQNGIFKSLYKSETSGLIFNELSHVNKNYFGYSTQADDALGQAPRDMDIAVNPNNVNEVHIAGINTWRSIDGGVTFNITSQWIPQNAAAINIGYCHADVDIMEYVGSTLYVGTDGGIFKATNPQVVNSTYYTDLTVGAGIRQFYKIGVSQTSPAIITGGSQDNGTSVYDVNGNWLDWLGADGMETFVDKNNSNTLYGTSQFGSLYRTTNGGINASNLVQPDGKGGQNTWNWITPFEQDPSAPNTIYVAFDILYKSTNSGSSWTPISSNFGTPIDHLKIAPSNNNYIYLAINNTFQATINGGTSWFQSPSTFGNINAIAVHPTIPDKVAIVTTDTNKIYISDNAGITWTSIKYDLPNFPAQAVAWDDNIEQGIYVGLNYGVYYLDNTTGNSWLPFSNNLPNVIISELEINYVENKLYAATYGRGLWRSDTYSSSLSTDDFQLNTVKLYPNPASNELNLAWDKGEDVSVKIFNSLGKLMYYSKDVNLQNNHKINTSSFTSGMYFVRINSNVGVVTKKLIIE